MPQRHNYSAFPDARLPANMVAVCSCAGMIGALAAAVVMVALQAVVGNEVGATALADHWRMGLPRELESKQQIQGTQETVWEHAELAMPVRQHNWADVSAHSFIHLVVDVVSYWLNERIRLPAGEQFVICGSSCGGDQVEPLPTALGHTYKEDTVWFPMPAHQPAQESHVMGEFGMTHKIP